MPSLKDLRTRIGSVKSTLVVFILSAAWLPVVSSANCIMDGDAVNLRGKIDIESPCLDKGSPAFGIAACNETGKPRYVMHFDAPVGFFALKLCGNANLMELDYPGYFPVPGSSEPFLGKPASVSGTFVWNPEKNDIIKVTSITLDAANAQP